ncbi:MAG: Co2+/Mg2+ efflux protein ApaG [Rickettsiales bacterium]|nr:Co2+/Mg2+ efflux protein ApaG [Rickettsiales bacterium]
MEENETVFSQTTDSIRVSVVPTYLNDQSEPEDHLYVWAYTVQVENLRDDKVQLINRHWQITDALGQMQEVRGEGVIGEQPVLKPGEAFRYTSGTALHTPSGIMRGEYEMVCDNGLSFEVEIPPFSLDSPHQRIN